jgi:hypothetical protein
LVNLPKKINLKLLKRLNRKDYRVITIVLIPAIVFLIIFLMFGSLFIPSSIGAFISLIIIYYWSFFREVFTASIIGIISFLIIVLSFFIIVFLLIKYNSGDIEWGVNIYEMFGLDK